VKIFPGLSIKWKLVLIMMLTSGFALLLSELAIVLDNFYDLRRAAAQDLGTVAQVVGENSRGALVFNDPVDAEQNLAILRAKKNILAASLYSKNGRVLGSYVRNASEEIPPLPKEMGRRFEGGALVLFEPVRLGDRTVGALYLKSDLEEMYSNLKGDLTIISVALAVSILAAFLLSFVLQKLISRPVEELAETVRLVSARKDYSVRAKARVKDEVGLLIDGFNEMLAQIQAQDAFLQTARDELEEKVKERTAELERSNRELEQFAYVASHDLQEPLRKVASYVELLARRYRGHIDPNADKFIGYITEGVDRMRGLIGDLLAYSRVGKTTGSREPTDLSAVAREALSNLETTIKESGAEVICDPLPTVRANQSQMLQLFQNLIGNAIKFRGSDPPRVRLSAQRKEREWVLSVRDNGIGIDAAHRDRIFVIFQRLHSRSEYPGTGIGLAICKKIVEGLGGRIWVESEAGKGSTFYFSLPV
jgi:signal transduction histidine kinase